MEPGTLAGEQGQGQYQPGDHRRDDEKPPQSRSRKRRLASPVSGDKAENAAAVCEDVGSAVARASPGFSPEISVEGGGDDVKVIVGLQVPTIDIPYVRTLMPVVRESATMRVEKTRCGF